MKPIERAVCLTAGRCNPQKASRVVVKPVAGMADVVECNLICFPLTLVQGKCTAFAGRSTVGYAPPFACSSQSWCRDHRSTFSVAFY